MAIRIPWDKYEVAILLDAAVRVLSGQTDRKAAIGEVSQALRKKATNAGFQIDSIFRNENGISMQLTIIIAMLQNKKSGLHNASKLFSDMVELYHEDKETFLIILEEAKKMTYDSTNHKEGYYRYVSQKEFRRAGEIFEAMSYVESFVASEKILPQSIFVNLSEQTIRFLRNDVLNNILFYKRNIRIRNLATVGVNLLEDYLHSTSGKHSASGEDSKSINNSEKEQNNNSNEKEYRIDFHHITSICDTKPTGLVLLIKGKRMGILSADSWPDLYVKFVQGIIKHYPKHFISGMSFGASHDYDLVDVRNTAKLRKPQRVSETLYLEINLDNNTILQRIISILDYLDIGLNNVFIKYVKTSNISSSSKKSLPQPVDKKQEFEASKPNNDVVPQNDLKEAENGINKILNTNYVYGFKCDSIRELMRFRNFAEELNVHLPESDEELRELILASGTIIDGKVFFNSKDMPQELCQIVDDIFSMGNNVIYYDKLFEKHSSWMKTHSIFSEDVLKEYLQMYTNSITFSKKFMVRGKKITEKDAVSAEIIRVWGESQINSVENLSDRLPYIPVENIWRVISGNDLFVLAEEGSYLFVDKLVITEEETSNIITYVEDSCNEKGFASLSDLPLESIEEENYELSGLAIQNAVFKILLNKEYCLNGKIITRDKPNVDISFLLKQYLSGATSCSFEDVLNKVRELTGTANRQYAFRVLYDEMIRVDCDHFISDDLINFDVVEIDRVLSSFIKDRFNSIRNITTFALFPLCGQNWNYYLLESFCLKYSKRYSLHIINYNDKNSGIIAETDCDMSYDDMLAVELARSGVELNLEVAGEYLFDTGFLSKRKYAKLDELLSRARKMREGS